MFVKYVGYQGLSPSSNSEGLVGTQESVVYTHPRWYLSSGESGHCAIHWLTYSAKILFSNLTCTIRRSWWTRHSLALKGTNRHLVKETVLSRSQQGSTAHISPGWDPFLLARPASTRLGFRTPGWACWASFHCLIPAQRRACGSLDGGILWKKPRCAWHVCLACVSCCALLLSRVQLFATPGTRDPQAPLSMGIL